jgi:hypothetical protein
MPEKPVLERINTDLFIGGPMDGHIEKVINADRTVFDVPRIEEGKARSELKYDRIWYTLRLLESGPKLITYWVLESMSDYEAVRSLFKSYSNQFKQVRVKGKEFSHGSKEGTT